MQLFSNPNIQKTTKQLVFNREESRHIVKVLRKKNGDNLFITNEKGLLFYAVITVANDKKCIAEIVSVEEKAKTWNYYLHIAIAPTKNIDRFEWFLEKATEIGIDEITPIICQNSERKIIKTERLNRVIKAAAKQSIKYNFPKLNEAVSFSSFIKSNLNKTIFIAHCTNLHKKTLKEVKLNSNYIILIGPEGDFSPEEIEKAVKNNAVSIDLGKNRLRTETAGVVATQNISFIHQ